MILEAGTAAGENCFEPDDRGHTGSRGQRLTRKFRMNGRRAATQGAVQLIRQQTQVGRDDWPSPSTGG